VRLDTLMPAFALAIVELTIASYACRV